MKVVAIYNKDSDIRCYHKNVFKTMDKFFDKYPEDYREFYDKNIVSLEIMKVDRLYDTIATGMYEPDANILIYSRSESLGHELFHMASNDRINKNSAIETLKNMENGMIEGMTEYLFMQAFNRNKPNSYPFEVFTVTMLEDIPYLFRPYFRADNKDFINLFPKKVDIYSLLYSLDIYNEKANDYLYSMFNNEYMSLENEKILIQAIKETIDNLITIELSRENNINSLNKYGDKFMDLISQDIIKDMFNYIYPGYINYTNKMINKRIRRKD